MPAFINSGGAIDLALVMVALEFAVLLSLRSGAKKIFAGPETFAHLCAAAALLGAAHLLLVRSSWQYPALALSAALAAHIMALCLRWRAQTRSMAAACAEAPRVHSATV